VHKWTPDEIEQLRQLMAKGLTYRQISQRLGRTHSSVRGAAQRYQMMDSTKCPGREPWSRAEHDALEELVAEGLTKHQIAERLERSYDSVRGAIAKLGMQDRQRQGAYRRRDDWDEIDAIITDLVQVEGMCGPQIAQRLALLGKTISRESVITRLKTMPEVRREALANARARRAARTRLYWQRRRARSAA
jgi:hypothetical protein